MTPRPRLWTLHENIEIRLFNPFWRDQNLVAAGLTDFKRINRRMHNKMTADNAMSIVGGRNVGDEYFLAKKDLNYSDLDVLVAGPVVDEVSTNFDEYWNSKFQCRRAPSLAHQRGSVSTKRAVALTRPSGMRATRNMPASCVRLRSRILRDRR